MPRLVVAIVIVPSLAAAEPTYLELGADINSLSDEVSAPCIHGAYGERLVDRLWAHVEVAASPIAQVSLLELRAGIEQRASTTGTGAYVGVDVAYVSGAGGDNPDTQSIIGGAVIPRFGVELGNAEIRLRLGIEVPITVGRIHDVKPLDDPPVDETTTRAIVGYAFTSGIVVQF